MSPQLPIPGCGGRAEQSDPMMVWQKHMSAVSWPSPPCALVLPALTTDITDLYLLICYFGKRLLCKPINVTALFCWKEFWSPCRKQLCVHSSGGLPLFGN